MRHLIYLTFVLGFFTAGMTYAQTGNPQTTNPGESFPQDNSMQYTMPTQTVTPVPPAGAVLTGSESQVKLPPKTKSKKH